MTNLIEIFTNKFQHLYFLITIHGSSVAHKYDCCYSISTLTNMLNLPNGVCSWLMVTIKVGAVRKKLNKACVLD